MEKWAGQVLWTLWKRQYLMKNIVGFSKKNMSLPPLYYCPTWSSTLTFRFGEIWWDLVRIHEIQLWLRPPFMVRRACTCPKRPWSTLDWVKNHQKWPVVSRQTWSKAAATMYTTFSVILDAKMGTRVFVHTKRGQAEVSPDVSSYFRKSIVF